MERCCTKWNQVESCIGMLKAAITTTLLAQRTRENFLSCSAAIGDQ